jgi:glucokinase
MIYFPQMRKGKFIIGVDLGGTKILSAIVSPGGRIAAKKLLKTRAASGKAAVIRNINKSIRLLLADSGISLSQISSIGIGAPGPILKGK